MMVAGSGSGAITSRPPDASRSLRVGRELAVVVGLTVVGWFVRTASMADFPLNDGGLFYRMVLDLQETWPALPETTTYNGLDAPFAYPPLGFYLGAVLHGWLGMDVMRAIPIAASVLTIPAFFLLARGLHGNGAVTWAATIAFSLMPRTFEWMTMGGGLTRAPGLLLAIVALWLAHRMLVRRDRWSVVASGVSAGLVILTHPQATLFLLISGVAFLIAFGRDRETVTRAVAALAIAAAIAAPWVVSVLANHGPGPLLSASATQPGPFIGLLSLFAFEITGSRLFDVLGLLAAIGFLVAILRRQWLVPAWLVALMVLDSRGGATYAAVPAAMLAGSGAVELLVRLPALWSGSAAPSKPLAFLRSDRLPVAIGAILLTLALIDAIGSQQAPDWRGFALTEDQRSAIVEAGELAPDGDYLVVTERFWAVDATSEWFPTLAGAHSAATVQGREWLGAGEFRTAVEASEALRECANAGSACLSEWSTTWDKAFTHVFIPKGSLSGPLGEEDCCTGLRLLLAGDAGYSMIHDGPGGTIFERRDG